MVTLGQDFEYQLVRNNKSLPSWMTEDRSVDIEARVDPSEKIQEIHRNSIKFLVKLKKAASPSAKVFGGAYDINRGNGIGGHIHFGGIYSHQINENDRIWLDNCLAWVIAGVTDRGERRRRCSGNYGALCQNNGYHRDRESKHYGFEYRTLPSPYTVEMQHAYFALAHFAARILEQKIAGTPHPVYSVITKFQPVRDKYHDGKEDEMRKISSWILKRIIPWMNSSERDGVSSVVRLLKEKKISRSEDLLRNKTVKKMTGVIPVQFLQSFKFHKDVCISNEEFCSIGFITPDQEQDALSELASRILAEGHVRYENMAERLVRSQSGVLAKIGNKIIGCVFLKGISDEVNIQIPNYAETGYLFVDKNYRRMGIARQLVRTIVAGNTVYKKLVMIGLIGSPVEKIAVSEGFVETESLRHRSVIFSDRILGTWIKTN